jgi:hypothetical protein
MLYLAAIESKKLKICCMSKDFIEMYFHLPFGDLVFEDWSETE